MKTCRLISCGESESPSRRSFRSPLRDSGRQSCGSVSAASRCKPAIISSLSVEYKLQSSMKWRTSSATLQVGQRGSPTARYLKIWAFNVVKFILSRQCQTFSFLDPRRKWAVICGRNSCFFNRALKVAGFACLRRAAGNALNSLAARGRREFSNLAFLYAKVLVCDCLVLCS